MVVCNEGQNLGKIRSKEQKMKLKWTPKSTRESIKLSVWAIITLPMIFVVWMPFVFEPSIQRMDTYKSDPVLVLSLAGGIITLIIILIISMPVIGILKWAIENGKFDSFKKKKRRQPVMCPDCLTTGICEKHMAEREAELTTFAKILLALGLVKIKKK